MSVYVIAEIGINHNGSVEIAKKLQVAAKRAGADAVKYQVGCPLMYVNESQWQVPRVLEDGSVVDYLTYRTSIELDDEQLAGLKAHAEGLGLDWFASPLDISAVPRLEALGVTRYKIASPMVTDLELLEAVAETGKPVIVSSGMTTPEDLDVAVNVLGWHNVSIMHCTSLYPCPPEHSNLRMITTLKERYPGRPIGYSGHEIGIPESVAAVALGAELVERHLTLSRAMWGSDHSASLEPEGLRRLIGYIKTVKAALGDGKKRIYEGEQVNAVKFRKSVADTTGSVLK